MATGQDMQLNALASELLSLGSEAELDHFFGNLVKKAIGFAGSPLGQTLVNGLKSVAKQALPRAAAALGNAIAPGVGGAIGQKVGSLAASHLEAEDQFLGDLLGEDQFLGDILGEDQFLGSLVGGLLGSEAEMEAAKDVIKVAAAATKKAKAAPHHADIRVVVRDAIMDAMKQYAPHLMHRGPAHPHLATHGGGGDGRWYRRGNKIILVGA